MSIKRPCGIKKLSQQHPESLRVSESIHIGKNSNKLFFSLSTNSIINYHKVYFRTPLNYHDGTVVLLHNLIVENFVRRAGFRVMKEKLID